MFLVSIPSVIVTIALACFYLANFTIYWKDCQQEAVVDKAENLPLTTSQNHCYYVDNFTQTLDDQSNASFIDNYCDNNLDFWFIFSEAVQHLLPDIGSSQVLKGISFSLFSRPPPSF